MSEGKKAFSEDPVGFRTEDSKCPKCGAATTTTAYGNEACSRSGVRIGLCEEKA